MLDNQPQLIPETYEIGIPHVPHGYAPGVPPVVKSLVKKIFQPGKIELPGAGLKRAANFYADYGGCGYWRMIWPEYVINSYQKAICAGDTTMIMDSNYYRGVNAVKVQRQATPVQADFLHNLREKIKPLNNMRMIYEIDDVVFRDDIPDYNRCKEAFVDQNIVDTILKIMKDMDEITVTCQYMKEYYMDKTGNKNITVIPNMAPKFWAGNLYDKQKLKSIFQRNKKKPRIGYTGSGTHFDVTNKTNQKDDFAHVISTIIKTRKKYQWVFMGAYPLGLKPYIDSGEIEFHNWAPLPNYMDAVAALDVNCLIAPLQDNTFNRCKSNIKYLEAAYLGIPAICQDMVTYNKDCPHLFKTGDELTDQIDYLMEDRSRYLQASDAAYKYADSMWLEDNIEAHLELYFEPFGSPNRKKLATYNP